MVIYFWFKNKRKKEEKMKKSMFTLLLIMFALTAFAAQRVIVGEVFTESW